MPCSLHSDSDQQKDNINRTQPLASSMCNIDILAIIFLLFFFQMAALNFNRILLMLANQGSIPLDTLQNQDGLNLGDVHFCPMRRTLHMQRISLDHLRGLIAEGAFMPPASEGPPKLAGLLPFSWSSRQTANMKGSQMSMWGS